MNIKSLIYKIPALYICAISNKRMAPAAKKSINRIRVVLAEKDKTNKWLASQLKKTPVTVSKWCTNSIQPSLETLVEIARVLKVDVRELINPTLTGNEK
jgi:putative transcriptional regulator